MKKKIIMIISTSLIILVLLGFCLIKPDTKNRPQSIPKKKVVPDSFNLEMTFYPQAPFADWNLPYQETCEEASILLVANYLKNWNMTLKEFDQELLLMVEWEKKIFGDYKHTDVNQTAKMIREYFGLNTVIHSNPELTDIAQIISKGHPIVAPFAGKLLKNPNFINGGPRYHMLVITGYKLQDQIVITQDVGTKRGADFVYSWLRLQYALHDWHPFYMQKGEPLIIEVYP